MKYFIIGALLVSLMGCASIEEQKKLDVEAESMAFDPDGLEEDLAFNTLEEAKHYADLLVVKVRQVRRMSLSGGINGILRPVYEDEEFNPSPDGKVMLNYELSEDYIESAPVVILDTMIWYGRKGIILTCWYGVPNGWEYSYQREYLDEDIWCDYSQNLSEDKAWQYLRD